MPLRSVYEVDIDDSKVRDFFDAFSSHREEVAGIGAEWARAQQRAGAAATGVAAYLKQFESEFKDLGTAATKSAKDQAAAMEDVAEAARKAATWQAQFGAAITVGRRQLGIAAKDAKSIAGDLAEGTRWLLKWSGISTAITGLVGAGSLFGLDRLAGSMANRRYEALGLGINTAQQQAMELAYGRFFNVGSTMSHVAGAQQDWSRRWAFSALGYDQRDVQNRNPAELTADMALRAKRIWDNSDQSQQFAQAHGLLEFYTMEDLRRLHAMSTDSLQTARAQAEQYARQLQVPEADQKAWTDFYFQLHAAGDKIENAFITSLGPLTPQLSHLSDAVAGAITTFLTAPQLKEWLTELGDGIKSAAEFLTSDAFKTDIHEFVKWLGEAGVAIKKFAEWVTGIVPSADTTSSAVSVAGAVAGARVGGIVAGPPGAVIGGVIGSQAGPYMAQLDFNAGLGAAHQNWLQDHPGGSFGDFYGWYVGYYANSHPGWKPPTQNQHGYWPTTPEQRAYWPQSIQPAAAPSWWQQHMPSWLGGGAGQSVQPIGAVDPSITTAINYFMGKGLDRAQATGIAARLAEESGSGQRIDPNAVNPNSGAYGSAQWLGGRKPAALATGGDLQKQLGLVWQEFQTTENAAYQAILKTHTAGDSARAMEQFERAGNPSFTEQAARRAAELYGAYSSSAGHSWLSWLNPIGTANATTSGFDLALGDSLAVGLAKAGGLGERTSEGGFGGQGSPSDRLSAAFGAVSGRTPGQVLAALMGLDASGARGKNILLSSGVSNDPSQIDLVRKQLETLKGMGAHAALLGVGEGVKNYAQLNDELRAIAKSEGVEFMLGAPTAAGGLQGTAGGRVHPRDYAAVWKRILHEHAAASTDQPSSAPNLTATSTGGISGSVGANAKVNINVHNLTGGSAIISANQIAH